MKKLLLLIIPLLLIGCSKTDDSLDKTIKVLANLNIKLAYANGCKETILDLYKDNLTEELKEKVIFICIQKGEEYIRRLNNEKVN